MLRLTRYCARIQRVQAPELEQSVLQPVEVAAEERNRFNHQVHTLLDWHTYTLHT